MARPQGKLTSPRKLRAAAPAKEPPAPPRKRSPRSRKRRTDRPEADKPAKRARRAPARAHEATRSPLAESVHVAGYDGGDPQTPGPAGASPLGVPAHSADTASAAARVMELHWGDEPEVRADEDDIVTRWSKRGDTLLRHLAQHGAARHEYRADLREGRFVWIGPDGRVSAEAEARVICRYSPTTSEIVMGWRDPLARPSSIARIDRMPAERDDIDEGGAWQVAMEAADAAQAEYLYRVTTPDAWYFLALSGLTFTPGRASWSPTTPVGLVLRGLGDARRAVESRAEPAEVLRDRIAGLGRSLVHEAEYAYRGTDWVARLERTGRRLVTVADRLPRSSFKSVARGRVAEEWLSREVTIELSEVLALLEDEWTLFA